MFRSNPMIDRFISFFSLPNCYFEILTNKECKKSSAAVAFDLLELFFSYKTFPDHYGPCRLWEVEKSNWKFYYGSNYQSHQRARILRKVQPRKYAILFDDKAVCDILCRGIGVNLPYTYGIISPDQDYKEKLISWFHDSAVDILIVKPLLGNAGRGIVMAKKVNEQIMIKSKTKLIPLQDFTLSETAIVQEVITQDDRMSVFSRYSLNTVRIVTMLTKKESVIILGAYMRCGVGESYVDNVSAGGLGMGVNYETGQLKKYATDIKGNKFTAHPTSKVIFEDFIIPEWQNIIAAAIKIQKAFPCSRLLGMDIALGKNGEPVIIEVNDSPDLLYMETTYAPLLQNKQILKAFGEYDLFVNKHQRELYNSLVIQ